MSDDTRLHNHTGFYDPNDSNFVSFLLQVANNNPSFQGKHKIKNVNRRVGLLSTGFSGRKLYCNGLYGKNYLEYILIHSV